MGRFFLISKLNLLLLNLIPLILVVYALDKENRLSLAFSQYAFHVPEAVAFLLVVLASSGFPGFPTHCIFKASENLPIILKMCRTSFCPGAAFLGVLKLLGGGSAESLTLPLQAQQYCTSQTVCSFISSLEILKSRLDAVLCCLL